MNDSASIHLLPIEDRLGDALMVMRRLVRESGVRDPIEVRRATTLFDLHLPGSTGVDTGSSRSVGLIDRRAWSGGRWTRSAEER